MLRVVSYAVDMLERLRAFLLKYLSVNVCFLAACGLGHRLLFSAYSSLLSYVELPQATVTTAESRVLAGKQSRMFRPFRGFIYCRKASWTLVVALSCFRFPKRTSSVDTDVPTHTHTHTLETYTRQTVVATITYRLSLKIE